MTPLSSQALWPFTTNYYLNGIKFKQDSSLHQYLSEESNLITRDRIRYRNITVYLELEKIIDRKNLFDSTNPQIIVPDNKLEDVLDVSRIHRDHLKQVIDKHFEQDYSIGLNLAAANEELKELTELRKRHKQITPVTDFDINGDYKVNPSLQLLIKTVTNSNSYQNVFRYREITEAISAYIMQNKEELFDLRNILVIRSDSLLKRVFRVNYFSRSQITSLIRRDLQQVRRSRRLKIIKRLKGLRI